MHIFNTSCEEALQQLRVHRSHTLGTCSRSVLDLSKIKQNTSSHSWANNGKQFPWTSESHEHEEVFKTTMACSSQRGNRVTNWNKLSDWTRGEPFPSWGQSSIGAGCPKGLGTLEIFWTYICTYFLGISIFHGKALNALAWPHSWTGFEMATALKAFWSPCQPEKFWFLEVLSCPLQFRSHAQTTQRSLHLAVLAVSVLVTQSNPLSTSHSLVHWVGQ